jgi:uncharacterized protein (DUF983 family)
MIWYKSCPRCDSGTIVRDRDWYVQCLQCGYMIDLEESAQVEAVLLARKGAEEVVAETA